MTIARQELGKSGEDLAAQLLEEHGYEILARRYRTRYGEIDIVARENGTVVFVEVKARTTGEFGRAAEAITPWKQRRLVSMATDFLARNQLTDRPCRFDVVAIDGAPPNPSVTIYRAAFTATD